ncbi:neurotransmitter-gated ion-channel ligand-binding protein [Phreatobacter aquaticus]|uniref:Neurotransmitter-gated ion-channel ligand-binding protein n=1 Tax=Phreatobacter aquaticus TaxID=2570229 RepID=A0A4D7QRK4_9HYPH|nr:neurotransmitter-gated ion-channel ligand-binding protein [Phreatobacter aquaticus]QCK87884.1 neurotransmitter-gated ion-channel ligand-binding protein [Phreatobacter aquaticus]
MRRLVRAILAALVALACLGPSAIPSLAQVSLPEGVELPIQVRLAVRVLNIVRLHEVLGEVGASVDFTQRWSDPAVAFDRIERGSERIDLVGPEAEARLKQMWSPDLMIESMIGTPRAQTVSLSLFHDGRVVLVRRFDADFRVQVSMGAFPFDRQALALSFVPPRHPASEVVLTTTEFDRHYSSIAPALSAVNWIPAKLGFRQDTFYGWNARPYSRLTAVAEIDRNWHRYVLRVFVPYFAIMSLSLFLLWAPERVISNTQRAPMVFSSLLALAALSFTFESSFPGSISMNSPIATMISMGYFYLIIVLLLDVLLSQHGSPIAQRYPSLLTEVRRNIRFTVPVIYVGLCLVVMLA